MSKDIPYSRQWIEEQDIQSVAQVLQSDYLTQGPAGEVFERSLASYFGVKRAVVCSTGTAALHLAYAGMGVNEKSLGLVPPITFAATANAFLFLNAEVTFCDVDPVTGLLATENLESVMQERSFDSSAVNLVAPVSFAGALAPLGESARIAQRFGFSLVEDAAHSPGAWNEDGGTRERSGACDHTQAAILSFHPVKHICCGEGGAVLTNDEELADRITHLRSHGIARPNDPDGTRPWFYEQTELGWNYRLTDIQSALGISQLARLDQFLERRRVLASRYQNALSTVPFSDICSLPLANPGHAWHLYVIRFHKTGQRDKAHLFLKERGIHTQIHYVPIYRHPYYERHFGKIRLPGAEKFYESCLSIPLFPKMTDSEQDRVIETLANYAEQAT
jgi:UDP-4-amino-4,6-dideoxy-N-acetyl-beta-L-altrosamine transaminase